MENNVELKIKGWMLNAGKSNGNAKFPGYDESFCPNEDWKRYRLFPGVLWKISPIFASNINGVVLVWFTKGFRPQTSHHPRRAKYIYLLPSLLAYFTSDFEIPVRKTSHDLPALTPYIRLCDSDIDLWSSNKSNIGPLGRIPFLRNYNINIIGHNNN